VNIRSFIIQKYSEIFIANCKNAFQLFERNVEFDHLITGVSQKFLDLKSTIQLTKLLLLLHCEAFNNDQMIKIIFNEDLELIKSVLYNTKSDLISDGNIDIAVMSKHVHFNTQDGSNISPPNDRRPGSWVDTWDDVCRIQMVLSSLHAMTRFCLKHQLISVFESIIKGMAHLSLRSNAQKAVRTLRMVMPAKSSFSVSSLSARLELQLPEMCLSLVEAGGGGTATSFLCGIVHNRTLIRCKAVWMSAAVLRYHLRWLLDAPPAVLSSPTGGGPSIAPITSNPDEANSHYRSAVWSSLDLVFDGQQESLMFAFPDKDPRLEACIYAIDSCHSPSSGSNLSYLFTEALRQINAAIVLSVSISSGASNAREALARGIQLDKTLVDLVKRTKDVDARVELHQVSKFNHPDSILGLLF
jgi:hypothetical protein